MKSNFLIIVFYIGFLVFAKAQTITSKLENHQPGFPEMDLVLLSFGADYPIKIGVLQKDGTLKIDLSDVDLKSIPQDHFEMFLSDNLNENLTLKCNLSTDLQQSKNLKAQRGGNIGLWYKNRWAGTLYAVSTEEIMPWLEDEAYMEPVLSSFFEIIYVTEPLEINTTCTNSWQLTDKKIEAAHTYQFSLQKGFNLLEYQIQEIYKTNPNETSSKPSKVTIANINGSSKIKWYVKYF
ncbi:hypothetical protein [uncultured Planktosalinus sp.]|uniref:hypothetical protein n=1 Tax=uncultured Planktosalinus sp. TaxID=1810935 RepID=UPI0030DB2BBF|tara:strand:+ start:46 stop:753 length:708 start_codon:yes stop_codon:yes gene_type:complete